MAFFQQLPANEGIGDMLGKGFAQTFGPTMQDQIGKFFEEKKESNEIAKIQKELAALDPSADPMLQYSTILGSRASPKAKEKMLEVMKMEGATKFAEQFANGEKPNFKQLLEGVSKGYIPSGMGQEMARDLVKNPLEEQLMQQFLQNFQGGGEEAVDVDVQETVGPKGGVSEDVVESVTNSLEKPVPSKPPRNTKGGEGFSQYSDEDLAKWTLLGGNIGKSATTELNRREKEKERAYKNLKLDRQQRKEAHDSTSKYAEDLQKSYQQSLEIKDAVGKINELASEGKTGSKLRNGIIKYLQSKESPLANLFIGKDQQALISASKTLAGGFKELFGAKPTQSEFFWYSNILPDILKSAPSNVEAASYFEKVADHKIEAQNIADEIIEKNGGYRPIDLDRQVRQRMKGKTASLVKEGEKIYNAQHKESSTPQASDFKKVSPGTPLSDEMVTKILEYTNQDPDKAVEFATQLGYKVE